MSPKQISKNSNSEKLPEYEQRVVDISLKNPDFGAKRLIPLLEKEQIKVSATTIYRILKRHGIQNREKRLAKIQQNTREATNVPGKSPSSISEDTAERIVEISLQNPNFGPRRLVPLLEQEGIIISSSGVYSLLRRRGLNTCSKRIAQLKEITAEPIPISEPQPVDIPAQVEADIIEISLQNPEYNLEQLMAVMEKASISLDADTIHDVLKRHDLHTAFKRFGRLKKERPPQKPVEADQQSAPKDLAPITEPEQKEKHRKGSVKIAGKSPKVLQLANLMLLLLIIYLGVQGGLKFRNINEGYQTYVPKVAPIRPTPIPAATNYPLFNYSVIWERDLFGTAGLGKIDSSKMEEWHVETIPPAEKDIGLKLVGTVVRDDSNKSLAIMEIRGIKKQEVYHEGEKAGKVKIKKILREKVVVTTDSGDKLLKVDFEKGGRRSVSYQPEQESIEDASSNEKPKEVGKRRTFRSRSVSLERNEVIAGLEDIESLMRQATFEPYERSGQPAGVRVSRIGKESLFRKIGLRSRDVITAVDDMSITSPEQTPMIFERLVSGDEVIIKVRRRRRTRMIRLNLK